MARVQMYTTAWCGYCVRAKALLDGKGIEYDEINLDDDPHFRQKLLELTGGRSSSTASRSAGTPSCGGSTRAARSTSTWPPENVVSEGRTGIGFAALD